MIKKVLATGAVAASILGLGATQAMAVGDDGGTASVNGNGASQWFGTAVTRGDGSPQVGLVQGSLNKPCVGLPLKANAGSPAGLVPVAVQETSVLSSSQNQLCTENSTQDKGDEPLSRILSDIPVLSGNGAGNG
ncbi:rodlin [Streptomyces sp. NPDC001834]|uniref:rodlin n=1 Tax=Streptomyces sp. NPDC001834 TaxID=3364616 RepID=UPI0036ADCFCF